MKVYKEIIYYAFPYTHTCEKCVYSRHMYYAEAAPGYSCSIKCKKNTGFKCSKFKQTESK